MGRRLYISPRISQVCLDFKKRVEAIISFKNSFGQISLWPHKAEGDVSVVLVGRALLTGTVLIHPCKGAQRLTALLLYSESIWTLWTFTLFKMRR